MNYLTCSLCAYRKAGLHVPFLPKRMVTLVFAIIITVLAITRQASARENGQQINLSLKQVTLEAAFSAIQQQTNFIFWYNKNVLEGTRPVTLNLKGGSINEALTEIFKDQPLTYSIHDQTIVVTRKATQTSLQSTLSTTKADNITGRVTDDKGSPLAGASVVVKGKPVSTRTDEAGRFALDNVPDNATLQISFVGFIPREIKITNNSFNLDIALTPNTSELDDVQIIAYGTTTKRFNTGNVSTLNSKDISKQPINNPIQALAGRVPGVFIKQSNGLANGGIKISIQGTNSISRGNDPFFVVDGVPYVAQLLRNNGAILGTTEGYNSQTGNPLAFIDPNEIESISILKDADATAIYGSRAANGAVLITTKSGKAGKTKTDINFQQGIGKVARKLDVLNTPQYLEMRHEALNNANMTPGVSDYDLNGLWDTTRYTDWQKVLIGNAASYTNVNAQISGGNANTQFLIGSSFHKETTVFPGDFADKKVSINFNIRSVSNNQRFKIQFSGNYMADINNLLGNDLTQFAVELAPVAPALYNPDGSLNWQPTSSGNSSWRNPLLNQDLRYDNKTNNLISNLQLSYSILKDLEARVSLGYNNLRSDETLKSPLSTVLPESRPNALRRTNFTNNNITSWIIEPQLTYKRKISSGRFELLIGSTIQQNTSNGQQLTATGFNSDDVLSDIKSAATITVGTTTLSTYKYRAAFGRINYNWQDKYIINLTARRDGSTRFGPENQYNTFGAVGIGWIFSNEGFIKDNIPFVSFGKLRASYGTTGNDQIGDYQFLNQFTPVTAAIAYQGITSIAPVGIANPFLQWEETKKIQAGLELGILRDRIILNANYFHNRSSNQLISYTLPVTSGFYTITKNFPATVQNSGWEISLTSENIKTKSFSWATNFNITIPSNKLVSFPGLQASSYQNSLFIGQPIGLIRTYKYAGVNKTTGLYEFVNSKGEITRNVNSTDLISLINTAPKYYGGMENTLSYKGFQLSFHLQFVKQIGKNYIMGDMPGQFFGTSTIANQPSTVLNRWKAENDVAQIQKYYSTSTYNTEFYNAGASDYAYSDASFIRLRNVSISYQLPKKWVQSANIQSINLFAQGQNLATITKYKGMDPETTNSFVLPPLRVITFGIRASL